jgi:hypothetical protein
MRLHGGRQRMTSGSDAAVAERSTVRAFAFEAVLVTLAVLAYFGVRGLTEGSAAEAAANALRIVDLERALSIAWERQLQELVLVSHVLVSAANWVYIWGHWPVIAAVACWLFFFRRPFYLLYRNALLISGGAGLVIFALFPVAPPRLMDLGTIDTVTQYSRAYRVLQPPAFVNQYAAMPSLHLGWDLLVCMALFQSTRWRPARLFALLLPPAMFAAIVLTANHYIVDGVAGIALALAGLGVARWLAGRRAIPGRAVATAGSRYPGDDAVPPPSS